MRDSEPETPEPADEERVPDIPEDVVEEAERLTRLARATERRDDDAAEEEATVYREQRDALAADHEYDTRLREADDTLVLYPEEWLVDGVVQIDRIEETDRAVELSLSGPGDPEHWEAIAEHNEALVAAMADDAPQHEGNARALVAFASNHYAKPVEELGAEAVREFLEEYYPRNAWPSETEASLVEESVEKVFEAAGADAPSPSEP